LVAWLSESPLLYFLTVLFLCQNFFPGFCSGYGALKLIMLFPLFSGLCYFEISESKCIMEIFWPGIILVSSNPSSLP